MPYCTFSGCPGRTQEQFDTTLQAHQKGRSAKTISIESIFKDRAALLIYSMPYMFEATMDTNWPAPLAAKCDTHIGVLSPDHGWCSFMAGNR